MKSLVARLSVAVLAIAGFAASTITSVAATKHQIKPVVVGTVGCPPLCMPRDPSHCGLD